MTSEFLDALRQRVILGDGAMGTELLARGHPLRVSSSSVNLSALNLSRPELVRQVHLDYRKAGAELHRTNTFTANRFRLRDQGLEKKVRQINLSGCLLARDVARKTGLVAGSVGPVGDHQASSRTTRSVYQEQIEALAEGGCDVLFLETFTFAEELRIAVQIARKATSLPVVACMAFLTGRVGPKPLALLQRTDSEVLGVNCVEPPLARSILRRYRATSSRTLGAFPGSGKGKISLSPERFAIETFRLVELGARLVGGCCGTTPLHIRALARRLGR